MCGLHDGKEKPVLRGESPGNVQATYPSQIISMDNIPSLPRSFKGNTDWLLWVDLFSGYVIAKASSSRTAQTIAEYYKECVFQRLGPVKRSATIESQDSCPISSERSIESRGRNNVQPWRTDLKRMGQQIEW